jgi:predicted aspartyl protease
VDGVRSKVFVVVSLLAGGLFAAQPNERFKKLCEAHRLFTLRDAIAGADAPAIYKGTIEAAFNDAQPAERDLGSVAKSAPNSDEAYHAHELLLYLYLRTGRYQRALEQDDALLAARPGAADAQNVHPLLVALSHYPDQSVTQRRSSATRCHMDDGNLFVTISLSGRVASYMLDSGANVSTMSESEAKRLGLTIHDIGTRGQDATGRDVLFRLAVAPQVAIGEMHLASVAFLILGDDQQPFVDSPPDERGVLGLPVLLALETIRWGQDGSFAVGFPPGPRDKKKSNTCLDGADLITQATVQERAVDLVVDTGASYTRLWPRFKEDFATLIASGQAGTTSVTGVAHSIQSDSIALPELKLRVGGFNAALRPATVLLKETTPQSRWHHGNLGMDLLSQAATVTMDFAAMTLTLR